MEKREEFNIKLKEAMRNKEMAAVSTIRLILAALKDRDISARGQGNAEGISETDILSMLQSMIKQRKESVKMYRDGGREDLATAEESEIVIIEQFLPQQLSDDEVAAEIDRLIAELDAKDIKDMGKVMGKLKSDYAGQIDMGKAGGLVKQKLG